LLRTFLDFSKINKQERLYYTKGKIFVNIFSRRIKKLLHAPLTVPEHPQYVLVILHLLPIKLKRP
jgi:hypothetical protein